MSALPVEPEVLDLLASVLDYPNAETRSLCATLAARLTIERPAAGQALEEFRSQAAALSAEELEELYTSTFDVNPACCLYVGHHLFGESYKRGAFMATLNGEYRAREFATGNELPDHLCVMLRFIASGQGDELARGLVEEALLPALRKIVKAFRESQNIYGALLRATLLALSGGDSDKSEPADRELPVINAPQTPSMGWES
ncbi:MAG: nitrate reductase molybdenum cofactor assembly chaperone [Gemmatimonadales bacterium]